MRCLYIPFTILLGLLFSCRASKVKEIAPEDQEIKQETYNVKLEIKEYELKKLEIFAERAEYVNDTTIVYNFKVDFYEGTNPTAFMLGDTALVQEYSGFIDARGNIKIVSQEGDSLISKRIIWNKRLNKIWSPEESVLYKRGKVIRSSGLESDPQLREVTFKGKVYVE